MRPWMALLALAPACGFSGSGGSEPMPDAGSVCVGSLIPICFPASALPTMARTLGAFDIDTDMVGSGALCDQNNDQKARYCVVTGARITLPVDMTLTAHGDKPLVLLSTGAVELQGTIDVSSHVTGARLRGAGADPNDSQACAFAMPATVARAGGGGAGASLGTQGGAGGNPAAQVAGGGLPGNKLAAVPSAVRGGCRGGDGTANVGSPAAGGDGGGAIAVIATLQIHLDGATINASGGGGAGATRLAVNGGGGGGSGGMIVFDSPQPVVFGANSKLWANGGSGGQGSTATIDGAGGGESSSPMTAASSTSVAGGGGPGGAGSQGSKLGTGGQDGPADGGGGGGGGGGGFIHGPGLTASDSISPPPS
ncbi:MAG TPA: hypothetical protein VHW23_42305 [Kofleriaceae bacterium]|nr:hypothetical protein [Kofleriaceae bacterium]